MAVALRPPVGDRPALTLLAPAPAKAPSDLVSGGPQGHYRRSRERLLLRNERHETPPQQQVLAWLRDHVNRGIPRAYYKAVLGHDLHISTFATLHVRHFHYGAADPFTGQVEFNQEVYDHWLRVERTFQRYARDLPRDEALAKALGWPIESAAYHFGRIVSDTVVRAEELSLGWWEDVGLVSEGKVTTAFRDFEVDQLQAESSVYGDYKFQRPGTSATAEANTDTTLVADTGLEATGTQTESAADSYRSVATVTADSTETWQEHQIRNVTGATGGTMMDRNLISPTVAVVSLDQVQFTYTLQKTAEA